MRDIRRFLRKGNLEITPYVLPPPLEDLQAEYGVSNVVQMSLNENLLGPSPRALAAIEREINRVNLYPHGPCTALRRKMSETLEIDEDTITITNGAENALVLVANAFINEGDEVVMADPTFVVYTNIVQIMGGKPVSVGLKDYVHDLDAMLQRIGPRTKLVFICNPNNPTGTIVTKGELDGFFSRLPESTLVVLDEAYFELVSDKDYPNGLDYIRQGRNVISLRTFSKVSGLAGLRIGYAMGCRELIEALNRVREAFPVSRLAQAAALAAWDDMEFRQEVLRTIGAGKAYLYDEFEKMNLPYVCSHTNFVFFDLRRNAQPVYEFLLKEGIVITPGDQWNCPTCARVTIGTMDQNRRFIHALKEALGIREE